MKFKEYFKKIPLLPLSALIFFVSVLILWKINLIPSPAENIIFLENLSSKYGLIGLFIACFLEGIVYLGLYFPGSFIAVLILLSSNGEFFTLLSISLIITITLTLTSLINYILGRHIYIKEKIPKRFKKLNKGILLSILHPNFLAFYFFNEGINNKNSRKILFVPLLTFPYYLIMAYIFYSLKSVLRPAAESPFILITAILIWFMIAFILKNKR